MQEIDGQTLMLLQDKHLMETMSIMSMKLVPALKIVTSKTMRQTDCSEDDETMRCKMIGSDLAHVH